jgi:hypothetical protein
VKKIFQDLEKLMDPSKNMKNFRDCLGAASAPTIPFLRKEKEREREGGGGVIPDFLY